MAKKRFSAPLGWNANSRKWRRAKAANSPMEAAAIAGEEFYVDIVKLAKKYGLLVVSRPMEAAAMAV